MTPDTLLYVKGGIAFAHDSFDVTDSTAGGGCVPAGPNYAAVSKNRFGPTVGLGVEHAFSGNVTGFAEVDTTDVGTQIVNFAETGDECSPAFTAKVSQTVTLLKFGVNMRY